MPDYCNFWPMLAAMCSADTKAPVDETLSARVDHDARRHETVEIRIVPARFYMEQRNDFWSWG